MLFSLAPHSLVSPSISESHLNVQVSILPHGVTNNTGSSTESPVSQETLSPGEKGRGQTSGFQDGNWQVGL